MRLATLRENIAECLECILILKLLLYELLEIGNMLGVVKDYRYPRGVIAYVSTILSESQIASLRSR